MNWKKVKVSGNPILADIGNIHYIRCGSIPEDCGYWIGSVNVEYETTLYFQGQWTNKGFVELRCLNKEEVPLLEMRFDDPPDEIDRYLIIPPKTVKIELKCKTVGPKMAGFQGMDIQTYYSYGFNPTVVILDEEE